MIKVLPVKTEKTFRLAMAGKYVFSAPENSTNEEIKTAIKGTYGVDVAKMSTIKTTPKQKMNWKTRIAYTKGSVKKVYVSLKAGQSLDIYK